jgi:hypothetical protein
VATLYIQTPDEYCPWSCGSAPYVTKSDSDRSLIVGVQCRLGNLEETDLALLDTAAEWSVIGTQTADLLEPALSEAVDSIEIQTRRGNFTGQLHRLTVSLVAEVGFGIDLAVDGTVLICPDWPGPTVLGYRGFLERVRIGLDPGSRFDEERLFFGEPRQIGSTR